MDEWRFESYWADPPHLGRLVLHLLLTFTSRRLRSRAAAGQCLSSAGVEVMPHLDPWCIDNNNMWRVSTDVIQVWTRTMMEIESMANQGSISRPGAWSFPDCLEVGNPGYFVYTWEETKAVVALFAVTSAPLILGNDARAGRMQPRLVQLLLNPSMLSVNQIYSTVHAYAGGRLWTDFFGREVWAKPLVPDGTLAIVLFNRAGFVVGETPAGNAPMPPFCSDPNSTNYPCVGCFVDDDKPWLAPCDDNVTASAGQQELSVDFARLPRAWLGPEVRPHGSISCSAFDIFATAAQGKDIGRFDGAFRATIPPHGVRFLLLSDCRSEAPGVDLDESHTVPR